MVNMDALGALSARVSTLQAEVDEAEGYAIACRAAATALRGPLGALAGVSVDLGWMRSRSTKVNRAKTRAEAAGSAVEAVRVRLSAAESELDSIARKYEKKAQALRLDLRAASMQLALAGAGRVG